MPLKEYENLTDHELSMADHYAEIGDFAVLRQYRELSASRTCKPTTNNHRFENKPIDDSTEQD